MCTEGDGVLIDHHPVSIDSSFSHQVPPPIPRETDWWAQRIMGSNQNVQNFQDSEWPLLQRPSRVKMFQSKIQGLLEPGKSNMGVNGATQPSRACLIKHHAFKGSASLEGSNFCDVSKCN